MKTLVALAAKCVGLAVLLLAGSGEASAQSLLTIRDGATGEVRTFTSDNSSFGLSGDNRSVYFTAGISSPVAALVGSWWSVKLEAPEGETLHPGQFANAGCPGWGRTGRAPGLQATDNNPVCRLSTGDSVWGSFVIRQIGFAADGRVNSLEATFVQRVGSSIAPALTGTLRYNAGPMQFIAKAPREFPWGYINEDNLGDTSFFALTGTTGGLTYDASVMKDQWRIAIAPPTGTTLGVGRYSIRGQADASNARLFIARGLDGQACNPNGELEIQDIQVDADGQVTKLRATFVYRCPGSTAALRGTIRHRL